MVAVSVLRLAADSPRGGYPLCQVINLDANNVVRLQLWDIAGTCVPPQPPGVFRSSLTGYGRLAGQERFGNMTRVYYKEAVAAFIVFDVTRVSTFEAVAKWKADIDSKVRAGADARGKRGAR